MLAPESIQVPAPDLVRVPVVVPRMLANVPPEEPPSVSPKVAPVIVPVLLIVIDPVSPTILQALPRVINPPNEAPLGELLITAPPEEIPVPFMVSASADE